MGEYPNFSSNGYLQRYMTTPLEVIRKGEEEFNNIVFPSNEGDYVEHIDMPYSRFKDWNKKQQIATLQALVEEAEGEKKNLNDDCSVNGDYTLSAINSFNQAKQETINRLEGIIKEIKK